MESDRLETNLGPALDDIEPELKSEVQKPARRFVGRRTAQQQQNDQSNKLQDAEESTSIQGKIKE
jgi:hypothetical protein